MPSKHTPGPWEATDLRVKGNYARVVQAISGETVANVADDPTNLEPTEESIANARLIAAAPDLLGSLKAAWVWLENERRKHRAHGEENEEAYMGALADDAKAAIYAAEGGFND